MKITVFLASILLLIVTAGGAVSAEIVENESSFYYEVVEYGGPCSTHIDSYYDLYGFTDKEEILAIRERGVDDAFGEFEQYWCSIPGTNYMFYPDENGAHLQRNIKNIYVDGSQPGYGYKGNPGAAIDDYVISASSFTVGNQSLFVGYFGENSEPTNPNIDRVADELGEKAGNQDNDTTGFCPNGDPVPDEGTSACPEICPSGEPAPEGGVAECEDYEDTPSGPTKEEVCLGGGGLWQSDTRRCLPYQPKTNDCQGATVDSSNCGIMRYLALTINTLSILAGVVITASIVIGGIQYSSAGSDPQKTSAAKNRIRNAIIALVLFIFGYALLNYLIPGGLL